MPAKDHVTIDEATSSYILFGSIPHPITSQPFNRASFLHNQKANLYSRPCLSLNTKAAQRPPGSHKLPSPKVQQTFSPFNTIRSPSVNNDTWTAVSNWLATSQSFEKPPSPVEEPSEPATVPAPAPPKKIPKEEWIRMSKDLDYRLQARAEQPTPLTILQKEYWLQMSNDLNLKLASRAEQLKALANLSPGSVSADSATDRNICNPQSWTFFPEPAKDTPLGQIFALSYISLTPRLSSNPTDLSKEQNRETETSILEADSSQFQEELAQHQQEQEQLVNVEFCEANDGANATATQPEATAPTQADEAASPNDQKEQLSTQQLKTVNKAVKAKAT